MVGAVAPSSRGERLARCWGLADFGGWEQLLARDMQGRVSWSGDTCGPLGHRRSFSPSRCLKLLQHLRRLWHRLRLIVIQSLTQFVDEPFELALRGIAVAHRRVAAHRLAHRLLVDGVPLQDGFVETKCRLRSRSSHASFAARWAAVMNRFWYPRL